MNLSDLNNLDLKDIVSAPPAVKAVILAFVFLAIIGGGWFLVWSDAMKALDSSRKEEDTLRASYMAKKGEAIHFDAYKRRLNEIEQSLDALLRQLPDRSQMDALLTDINQAGVGRGLEFELFKPGSETLADYYATLPVSIKVVGTYHDMGGFLSDLSKLPRIVTVHDVALTPTRMATWSWRPASRPTATWMKPSWPPPRNRNRLPARNRGPENNETSLAIATCLAGCLLKRRIRRSARVHGPNPPRLEPEGS